MTSEFLAMFITMFVRLFVTVFFTVTTLRENSCAAIVTKLLELCSSSRIMQVNAPDGSTMRSGTGEVCFVFNVSTVCFCPHCFA